MNDLLFFPPSICFCRSKLPLARFKTQVCPSDSRQPFDVYLTKKIGRCFGSKLKKRRLNNRAGLFLIGQSKKIFWSQSPKTQREAILILNFSTLSRPKQCGSPINSISLNLRLSKGAKVDGGVAEREREIVWSGRCTWLKTYWGFAVFERWS